MANLGSNVAAFARKYAAMISSRINIISKRIINDVGQEIVDKMKLYIQQYWYSTYSPQNYQRTYSLLDAISYRVEDKTAYIYIDESKFQHSYNKDGWGQHVGFYGEDFGEGLIEFIENGSFSSGRSGSPKNPRIGDGSEFLEKTMKWINEYVKTEIRKRVSIELGVKVR